MAKVAENLLKLGKALRWLFASRWTAIGAGASMGEIVKVISEALG